ncbi:hypothetical protein VTL71DRAFT_6434 [Oculimacula yallundae]|uniref:Uncharacterized protein n=1 Tax=Oculimacula yallundae TaxID=86028 RepID=A0ABR4BZK8_9HELO
MPGLDLHTTDIIYTIDTIGTYLFIYPMSLLTSISYVNLLDDIGIVLIVRPMSYLQRFAEFLMLVDDMIRSKKMEDETTDWRSEDSLL